MYMLRRVVWCGYCYGFALQGFAQQGSNRHVLEPDITIGLQQHLPVAIVRNMQPERASQLLNGKGIQNRIICSGAAVDAKLPKALHSSCTVTQQLAGA